MTGCETSDRSRLITTSPKIWTVVSRTGFSLPDATARRDGHRRPPRALTGHCSAPAALSLGQLQKPAQRYPLLRRQIAVVHGEPQASRQLHRVAKSSWPGWQAGIDHDFQDEGCRRGSQRARCNVSAAHCGSRRPLHDLQHQHVQRLAGDGGTSAVLTTARRTRRQALCVDQPPNRLHGLRLSLDQVISICSGPNCEERNGRVARPQPVVEICKALAGSAAWLRDG